MNPQQCLVIASVLKPVGDTRMYEKFALSLAGRFSSVHLVGASSGELPTGAPENVFFHPVADFLRLSSRRLHYFRVYFALLRRLRPDVLIINTPELLLPTLVYRVLHRCRIIYDVMENYWRNILHQPTYPALLRLPLALTVRTLEYLSRFFVSHYLLAERNYEKEFSFTKGKSTIIENKYRLLHRVEIARRSLQKAQPVRLLYSGTVSRVYGAKEAIELTIKLHQNGFPVRLRVIGFCSDEKYFSEIEDITKDKNCIDLQMVRRPVPHRLILEAIAKADLALLPYHFNESTVNCIPTKLYEHIAFRLPMVLPHNPLWQEVCTPFRAAVFIDFQNFSAPDLWNALMNTPFYENADTENAPVYWHTEEKKLVEAIEQGRKG